MFPWLLIACQLCHQFYYSALILYWSHLVHREAENQHVEVFPSNPTETGLRQPGQEHSPTLLLSWWKWATRWWLLGESVHNPLWLTHLFPNKLMVSCCILLTLGSFPGLPEQISFWVCLFFPLCVPSHDTVIIVKHSPVSSLFFFLPMPSLNIHLCCGLALVSEDLHSQLSIQNTMAIN